MKNSEDTYELEEEKASEAKAIIKMLEEKLKKTKESAADILKMGLLMSQNLSEISLVIFTKALKIEGEISYQKATLAELLQEDDE